MKQVAKVCMDRLISVPSRADKLETTPQQQAWEKRQWRARKAWSEVSQASFFHCMMKNTLATTWSDTEEAAQKIFFPRLIQRLSGVLLRWAVCLCVVCFPDW